MCEAVEVLSQRPLGPMEDSVLLQLAAACARRIRTSRFAIVKGEKRDKTKEEVAESSPVKAYTSSLVVDGAVQHTTLTHQRMLVARRFMFGGYPKI